MRRQLLIASLAVAFTAHVAAAQSAKSKTEPAATPNTESTEPLKADEATEPAAKPARKSAKRRETSEQKARRIARKYGKRLIASSDAHRLDAFGSHFTSIPRPTSLNVENVLLDQKGELLIKFIRNCALHKQSRRIKTVNSL